MHSDCCLFRLSCFLRQFLSSLRSGFCKFYFSKSNAISLFPSSSGSILLILMTDGFTVLPTVASFHTLILEKLLQRQAHTSSIVHPRVSLAQQRHQQNVCTSKDAGFLHDASRKLLFWTYGQASYYLAHHQVTDVSNTCQFIAVAICKVTNSLHYLLAKNVFKLAISKAFSNSFVVEVRQS